MLTSPHQRGDPRRGARSRALCVALRPHGGCGAFQRGRRRPPAPTPPPRLVARPRLQRRPGGCHPGPAAALRAGAGCCRRRVPGCCVKHPGARATTGGRSRGAPGPGGHLTHVRFLLRTGARVCVGGAPCQRRCEHRERLTRALLLLANSSRVTRAATRRSVRQRRCLPVGVPCCARCRSSCRTRSAWQVCCFPGTLCMSALLPLCALTWRPRRVCAPVNTRPQRQAVVATPAPEVQKPQARLLSPPP